MEIFRTYIFYLEGFSLLSTLVFSLRLINNSNAPAYMKDFYWYPLIGVITTLPAYVNLNLSDELIIGINNVSLTFHFSFLSLFIIRIMPLKKRTSCIYLFLFFLSVIIFGLVRNDITIPLNKVFASASFGLTVFCLLYFYQLFNNAPLLNLLREPSFWIVTGVFFAMSLCIPFAVFIDYLRSNLPTEYYIIFSNLLMFCYTIMHLFFIKAFICSVQKRKVSLFF